MYMPTLRLNEEELSHFNETIQKEWLITNGLGGYASSTVLGVNTRKYHGLLVAALHPPGDRTVCLAKLDEEIAAGNEIFSLGTNEFSNVFYPDGFRFLKDFSVSPIPRCLYIAGHVEFEKIIFMQNQKNLVATIYRIRNERNGEATIRITPLVTCRHFHSVLNKSQLNFRQKQNGSHEVELGFDQPKMTLVLRVTEGVFQQKPNWIERLIYREEAARGESSIDDCFQPGCFELAVPAKGEKEFAIVAAAGAGSHQSIETMDSFGASFSDVKLQFQKELQRKADFLNAFISGCPSEPSSDWLSWAVLAAESFVVQSFNANKNIIAGYHWFETWGRDTFVSLPGLMLVTGRFAEARSVLENFIEFCIGGLIPNFLSDLSMQPSCNTVDASLWYVNSVLQYVKYTGDFDFVRRELWESLQEIMQSHINGAGYGIHMDDDGLLAHGPRLTWMDAETNGKAVTPREGKAVEIQALWYNALKTAQLLSAKFGEQKLAESYCALSKKVKAAFNGKFWNSQRSCLFDVLDKSGTDSSLRPNQVIAASLDFTMLDPERAAKVADVVHRELLTSCGLRTLERADPRYRGRYFGDRASRDEAYHSGTVWPWLIGPFTSAFLKAKGYSVQSREYAGRIFIERFFANQIVQSGLGTVNEIFDGDSPHSPRGCISQAWSIAEPLRAYAEDVLQMRPKFEKELSEFTHE